MRMRVARYGLCLVLAACGTSASTTSQQTGGPAAKSSDRPFTATPVTTFKAPWAMSFLPESSTALVTEKRGQLVLVDVSTGQKQSVSGAPAVVAEGQGGLLDVVVSPRFASDGKVYLTFSEASPAGGTSLALARGQLVRSGGTARLENVTTIWHNPSGGHGGHYGARIAFAPDGNSLFLSAGERQRFLPAQDADQPLGKILHLTLDGKPAGGNPFAGRSGAATVNVTDPPENSHVAVNAARRPVRWPGPNLTPAETYTNGHRNPLGIAFAPDGRLWEAEMGPKGGDELNLILPGRNYGWPRASNGSNYDGTDIPDHKAGDGFEPPKVFWNPSISPAGLLIYTGSLFPEWRGDAFIPALSGQALIHVRIRGDQASKADQWDMGARIRAVQQGPKGEIYLLEDGENARLLRLAPAAQTRR